ncbi:MAG: hypothetical protein Q4G40_13015, partial [Brachybacterium sp.]|nr:hypothetical protein [Brachybacterium sp.]
MTIEITVRSTPDGGEAFVADGFSFWLAGGRGSYELGQPVSTHADPPTGTRRGLPEPQGFDTPVVVGTQQDEVLQARGAACPPRDDVVGLAA